MSATTAPTINTYISDMLALETHLVTPLQNQIADDDVAAMPAAIRIVNEAYAITQRHIEQLEARLEDVGGHGGAGVKNAVSSAFGAVASAVNKVRKTEVSKSLRDDYTALSLASAGYTMLHTAALGLGDRATADLAQDHLTDVATVIMRISKVLPSVVLAELQIEGVTVNSEVAGAAEADAQSAWKEGAQRSRADATN